MRTGTYVNVLIHKKKKTDEPCYKIICSDKTKCYQYHCIAYLLRNNKTKVVIQVKQIQLKRYIEKTTTKKTRQTAYIAREKSVISSDDLFILIKNYEMSKNIRNVCTNEYL